MDSEKKGTDGSGVIPLKPGNRQGHHGEPDHDPKWHDTETNEGAHKIDTVPGPRTH